MCLEKVSVEIVEYSNMRFPLPTRYMRKKRVAEKNKNEPKDERKIILVFYTKFLSFHTVIQTQHSGRLRLHRCNWQVSQQSANTRAFENSSNLSIIWLILFIIYYVENSFWKYVNIS